MTTRTRQQLTAIIETTLENPLSQLFDARRHAADAVTALADCPELLRALADEVRPPTDLADGYVIALHEDATKYGGDRTLSLWCDDVWRTAGGALTGHAEFVDEDGWHVFGLVEIPLPDYAAEVARAAAEETSR